MAASSIAGQPAVRGVLACDILAGAAPCAYRRVVGQGVRGGLPGSRGSALQPLWKPQNPATAILVWRRRGGRLNKRRAPVFRPQDPPRNGSPATVGL